MKEFIICGIDPGLASGGLVLLRGGDSEKVLRSQSLVEKKGAAKQALQEAKERAALLGGWGDDAFTAASVRSSQWILLVKKTLDEIASDETSIDFFAIESFVDQPSRARQEKAGLLRNRWQTPLSMGRLAEELARRGYTPEAGNVFYQNAGTVLRQWKTEIALLEQKGRNAGIVVDGDNLVTNDHERKALVHALALSLRLGEKGNLDRWKSVYSKEHTS